MARRWTWFWLGCWCTLVAVGQAPCTLRVSDGVVAVPGATVWLNGRPMGATNASGEWTWDEIDGRIDIRAVGFTSVEVEGEAGCPGGVLPVVLSAATYELGGATVVGSLSPVRLNESPIRTTVLGESLKVTQAQDLLEALDFTTGVRETVGCGVCGTNSVQLNGMEGVYSLVLIDGVPLLGGLASAYALDGIPLSLIQQVEVIRVLQARGLAVKPWGCHQRGVVAVASGRCVCQRAHGRPWKGSSVGHHGIWKGRCALAIGVGRPSLPAPDRRQRRRLH